jgi:hypothetical protein
VDDQNKIYQDRPYQGIVPQLRDTSAATARYVVTPQAARQGQAIRVLWIGFQQKQFFSRVFIQTDRAPAVYTVYKTAPRRIVIDFPGGSVATSNNVRPIVTEKFDGPVAGIKATRNKKGASIAIELKRDAGYLYRQEGNYIYVDVER